MTPYRLTYLITDARVVAILGDGGGAVVEQCPCIVFEEGRIFQSATEDRTKGGGLLAYYASFEIDGAPENECTAGTDAAVVVSGTLSSGGWIEVRGAGSIYYDEHGNISGEFDEAPRIVAEQKPPWPEVQSTLPELSTEEWMKRMASIEPKTSADFERAIACRDFEEDDDG